LNELAETVSTLFSPILDRQQDPYPRIETHPFGEREKGVNVPFYPKITCSDKTIKDSSIC
jgi:hypothetical protein